MLTASLSSPFPEGSPVTLSCETKLLPQSPGWQLYFSFYVGSETLEDRNTSSEYYIPSAKREDSGLYWCEVATEDGSILKRSPELELRILGECMGGGLPFLPQPEGGPLVSRAPHFIQNCTVFLKPSLNFLPFLSLFLIPPLPLSHSSSFLLPSLSAFFPLLQPSLISYRKR